MGVKVNAAKDEMTTDPEITILNSRKRRPVIPSRKTIGKKTATRVIVVDITAKNISFEPSIPACLGDIPLSILRYMFSVTTMASSTTRPTESTTANIDNTLIENPARYIIKNAPTSEMGITATGIRVTRQSRRKTKIMIITNRKAT